MFILCKILYKSELADKLGMSEKTLSMYLNERYFQDLRKMGYKKRQKHLTPKQIKYLEEKLVIL